MAKVIYHRSVYMPSTILNITPRIYKDLNFSDHALEALVDDDISIFDEVKMSGKNIVEATVVNGFLTEVLLEQYYDYNLNMYVALTFNQDWRKKEYGLVSVKTVYLAEHDRMELQNKSHLGSKYYRPANMSQFRF